MLMVVTVHMIVLVLAVARSMVSGGPLRQSLRSRSSAHMRLTNAMYDVLLVLQKAEIPVIFLLSVGADPTESIEVLARRKKVR